jgi:hypothetical protein
MKTFVDPSPTEYNVNRLRLDPNNPRLKLQPGGDEEKALIERLCRMGSQSPGQVVKHILTDRGYLHNEIPVVFKEAGKSELIVIDGNRRVAALKMILNPSLIPSTRRGLKSDCESAAGLVPSKIRCWVTHSRSDAKRIVYRAHNEGSREWESLSKYATHYDYHKDGVPISEIVDITGFDQSSIVKQINTWLLVEAMIEHIPDFEIESSGITSFERVTSHYSDFHKAIGIGISQEGLYQIPSSVSLIEMIHKIYLSSAKSSGFSRQVENNDASRKTFLKGIIPEGFRPDHGDGPTRKDAGATPTGTQSEQRTESQAGQKAEGSSARPHTSPAEALPSERQILLVKKNVGRKAYAIYKEFVAIQDTQQDFPIASAALTRAMIETTLKFHAKRLNCYTETAEQQMRSHSDSLDQVAVKLKQKIASMNSPYCADLLAAITNCSKVIPELNDVMHKDGTFAARPAVRTALAALASAVENLVKF